MEQQTYTDIKFLQRFVSDFKIPIEEINPDIFETVLKNYNTVDYNRWLACCNYITNYCHGDVNEYLDYYYNIRETLISKIKDNPVYKETISTYDYKANTIIPCDNIKNRKHKLLYNEENINKTFVSIDIKEANFNAIRYIAPEVFLGESDYSSWLNIVITDLFEYDEHITFWTKYFTASKYTRQVIFGQANPKFHISIETRLMTKLVNTLYTTASEFIKNNISVDVVNSDEIIFEILDTSVIPSLEDAIRTSCEIAGLPDIFKITNFKLNAYDLYNESTQDVITTFYIKNNTGKLYNLHKRYYLIVFQMLANNAIPNYLKDIRIDGVTYQIKDKLSINLR